MGERGPVPQRTEQRRRTNADPAGPVTKLTGAPSAAKARRAPPMPSASRDWHPIARRWFTALGRSGQREFYEPSDWMEAFAAAEVLSRLLLADKLSAVGLAAWTAMSARLLTTEGDRRRVRIELGRHKPASDPDAEAGVTSMAGWVSKLAGAG